MCAGTYYLTVADANGCQATQSFVVDQEPLQPVSVTISASANPVNFGAAVTLTAIPVNGGDNPVFQWKNNGVVVGGDTNVYVFNPVQQDTLTCTLTSDLICAAGNPAISQALVVGVNPNTAPCPGIPNVVYGGQTYHTIQIGNQCWLKENLDVGIYVASTNTGTFHSDVSDNSIIEKYCYENNESNCATYGGLYDWNEAMGYVTTPGTQGICPPGWHIPTRAEFETLMAVVNNDGYALKLIGQGGGAGTNISGFSALLSGYRYNDGRFFGLGYLINFCSSSEYGSGNAYYLYLGFNGSDIGLYFNHKVQGFSVRCVKN